MSMKREMVDEPKIETSDTDAEVNFIEIDGIQYLVGVDISHQLNNNDSDSEVSE